MENKDFYHPICVKMVAQDLRVDKIKKKQRTVVDSTIWFSVAAAVGLVAVAVTRMRK